MLATQPMARETTIDMASRCARLRAPFLKGLLPLEIEHIVEAAACKRYHAESIVISQGERADRLFLLIQGRARYFFLTGEGKKLLLHWIVPGEMFGGAALLLPPASYIVGTEMVKDGMLLAWKAGYIRQLASRYPRLLDNAVSIFADYLAFYVAAHASLTCHTARQRLGQLIVTLAATIGRPVHGGIELDVTNEELANASNISIFTASRLINEWQRRGILVKTRHRVLLCSPERLSLGRY